MTAESCPQCKSEKTEYRGFFDGWHCKWCGREWIDLPTEQIVTTVDVGDEFRVGDLKNPLTVTRVNGRKLYLEGQQSGEYYLHVHEDGSATFYRKKAGSERNQFGKRWSREERDVELEYLDNQ
ncbi:MULTISPECIES: hypothetical protein [Halorussus]|uniref:hypothetical protein n=1 Tax=Halorussus TaxID=1070314 RepID=UPI0020A02F9D|nr:hypothetical protein [Halorussus vallis]USZ78656.1 hypothetical protein NGM07_25240 [Halorussus vallis]USZ78687.1 hypothetical protein NGM07_24565 [Halorussus vallis]